MTDETPRPLGRPTIYSEELAALICERVATSSVGIRRLCQMYDDMPVVDTIFRWRHKYPAFSESYTRAKITQIEIMAEEIIDIADDGTNDWMESHGEDQPAGWKLNGEHIARSRLRIDTRKWLAAKLSPTIYGGAPDKDRSVSNRSEIEQMLDSE